MSGLVATYRTRESVSQNEAGPLSIVGVRVHGQTMGFIFHGEKMGCPPQVSVMRRGSLEKNALVHFFPSLLMGLPLQSAFLVFVLYQLPS